MEWYKIQLVAVRRAKSEMRNRAYLFALMLPLMIPIISVGLLHLSRPPGKGKIIVLSEPESLQSAEMLVQVINAAGTSSSESFVAQLEPTAKISREKLLELSEQIRKGELLAILEIADDNAKSAREFRFYAQASNPNGKMAAERICTAVNLAAAYGPFAPADIAASAGLQFKFFAPLRRETQAVAIDDDKHTISTMILLFLSVVIGMITQLLTPTLKVGLNQERDKKFLDTLLMCFDGRELLIGKLLGSAIAAGVLYSVYFVLFLVPSAYLGYLNAKTCCWFPLFAAVDFLFFAVFNLILGTVTRKPEEADRIGMLPLLLQAGATAGLVAAMQAPDSELISTLRCVPIVSSYLAVARVAVLPSVGWFDPLISLVASVLCVILMFVICIRLAKPNLLLGEKALTAREMFDALTGKSAHNVKPT